ncbi:hypothetical protein E2C01_081799 [Portunus trituberculatus]|uniref:Uncharacterized protein n=1 Tax=Portunus trituberculatus TaxID=210409 RepID=A0A5B7J397_PORTR|nr:hypothetical protein [Portunus trituberculatus]
MGFIADPPITEEVRIGKEPSLDSLKLEPPITGPGAAGSSDSPKLSTKEFTITVAYHEKEKITLLDGKGVEKCSLTQQLLLHLWGDGAPRHLLLQQRRHFL